ncbi:OmpA family protein [Limnobacter alexandrii]|uniref:OmpA family protein n=1 Tax=Limnobacter alexandrii TaxID=2570352 RepID=UPI001108A224|nr:OmpA family protein [Limnobacter alexandrii]
MLDKCILKFSVAVPFFFGVLSPGYAESLVVDLAGTVPAAEQVKEGLFPEEACEELRKNGFKCMGFKPAVRFSIPNAHFQLGSAELPAELKKQLDVFAQVLSNRPADSVPVLVTGHADASGNELLNQTLSAERAKAVKSYLIHKGVSPALLRIEGKGAEKLADVNNPFAPANRRVEISRLP